MSKASLSANELTAIGSSDTDVIGDGRGEILRFLLRLLLMSLTVLFLLLFLDAEAVATASETAVDAINAFEANAGDADAIV